MSFFSNLDEELQKDLIDFVKEREGKPWPKKLGDSLLTDVFKAIGRLGCVIDADHTGNIVMKFYNPGKHDYIFRAGDTIAQLFIQRVPISASNR